MIQLTLIVAALLSLALGCVVIANNHNRAINVVYFLLSCTAAIWLCANALVLEGRLTPDNTSILLLVGRLITPSAIILTFLMMVFTAHFVKKPANYIRKLLFAGLLGAPIVFLSFSDWNVYLDEKGMLALGWLSYPFVVVVLVYLITALWLLFFNLRGMHNDESYAVQVNYLRNSFIISVFPAALFGAVLPLITDSELVNLSPILSIIFLLYAAWLIIKHRLFDVRPVVARVITYALLLILLVILFGLFAALVTRYLLGSENTFTGQILVPFILAVVMASIFRPIKRYFDRITNRLFYQDAYDPQQLMDELNKTIVSTIEIKPLLTRVSLVIEKYVKSSYLAFVIKDVPERLVVAPKANPITTDFLDKLEREVLQVKQGVIFTDDLADDARYSGLYRELRFKDVAMIARLGSGSALGHPVGFLILGDKKSGSPYGGQDRRTMDIIVSELIIAIQNALRFEEIERFSKTLQRKVEDATAELRQKNNKLKLLDQTKDDFISMASHQLRTPLTSVKGYISMVLDGDVGKITDTQRKLLNQSYVSSQRMVYLISDLLNVSRLKTGKFIIEPVPSNLADVIQEEMDQLQETAKGKSITLNYKKPANFPTLMLDETKLRQVIMNFADNALYYTPTGGEITVHLTEKPDSIEFMVVDNGIGVPKREQHQLFTKFYRAHNAKRMRPDGTGLGLFMAKKVIVAQGGAIIFKSAENKGSTFGFTFPKAKLLPKEKEPATPEPAKEEAKT